MSAIGRCDVGADSCSTDTIRKLVDALADHRRPAVSDALVNEIVDEGKFFVAEASRYRSCHTIEYTNRRAQAQDRSKCPRRLPSRSCSTATQAASSVPGAALSPDHEYDEVSGGEDGDGPSADLVSVACVAVADDEPGEAGDEVGGDGSADTDRIAGERCAEEYPGG